MIIQVTGPSVSLMIGAAAFLVVFGLLVWLVGRRKGDRHIGRFLLVGLPGVYLAGLPSIGATKWLYIPGLSLLAAAYVMQFVPWIRHKTDRDT